MKNTLAEMLQAAGFEASAAHHDRHPDMLALRRVWNITEEVDIAWQGRTVRERTYSVDVFINLKSCICRVDYFNGPTVQPYKSRWYDTTGKRTFNAIAATVQNAGFEI